MLLGLRLLKNIARRNVVGRLEAMGQFAIFDGSTGAPIDPVPEKGAAGRISTAGGALLTYAASERARRASSPSPARRSSDRVRAAMVVSEAAASVKSAAAVAAKERKNDAAAIERPLRKRMHTLGFIDSADAQLPVRLLDQFSTH